MKRVLILVLLVLYMCPFSWAQSTQDKRRVEEGKRKDLFPSEFYLPEAKKFSPPDIHSGQNAYFSELLTKEVAGLSDAYKTLVILMGADGRFRDIDSQFDFLKGKGIIPGNINKGSDHDAPLRKGVAAYMFAKTMDIKGGITLRVFGLNERYAFKELVYQEIMNPGNVNDVMSGRELILTLTQSADYMSSRKKVMDTNKEL